MEYCGDFGSLMSQHSWTGQQGDISCPAAVSLARETVSELGAHQVFDERLAHGYNHQMFGRTAQVFDTMSNHAYPPQDHPSYHQLTHTSTYPPPYYHFSPYLPPYYPPYQELFMNSSAVTFAQGAGVSTVPTWHQQCLVQQTGTAEHASLLFDSKPTEMIQSCAIQGVTAALNFQVQASASAMDCQKVPSVYATYNEDDCFTKCEQKPHHGTETQSICDMLAHIQAKLTTVSENLSQDLKRMKSWESKQPASSQPNTSTQEAINMSDEMPVYDVYEDVTACRSRIHPTVDINEAEQIEVKKDSGNPRISPERPTVGTVGVFSLTSEQSICDLEKLNDGENLLFEKQDIEQFLSCSRKALKCRICDEEAQGDEKKLWDKTVCRTAIGHSVLFFLWDPGATKFPVLFMTAAHATRLQSTYVYSPAINSSEILRHMVTVLSCWLFSFENRYKMQWDPGIANSSYMYSWLKMRAVVRLTWLQRPSVSDLQCQLSMSNTSCVWDPGDSTILNSTLNRDIVGVLQTSILTTSGTFTLPYVLTVRVQFGELACVPQQSCYGRVQSSQENHGIHFLWDPGIVRWSTFSAQHILEPSMEKGNIFSTGRMLPWNP